MTASTLTTTFDPLFRKYSQTVPVSFLRALAKKESNFNPNDSRPPAYGLLQLTQTVVDSYNKDHGTSYTLYDTLNPDLNVKLGVGLLERIAKAYAKHPSSNMRPNWRNPEFVKLVLAGWNSGYSEGGGVGKVASYLEARGMPVTHDNVFAYASSAGATSHLQNTAKQNWQRSVSDLYFAQPYDGPGGGFLLKAAIAIGAGLLLSRYVFR